MYCSKCGTQIPDGSKFCPKCGSSVGGGTGGASTQANPQPPGGAQPQVIVIEDKSASDVTPTQQTFGTLTLVVGIIALIVLFSNLILAFAIGIAGDVLGIFSGDSTVGKVGKGLCSFVIGACVVIWIALAVGVASCLGYLN